MAYYCQHLSCMVRGYEFGAVHKDVKQDSQGYAAHEKCIQQVTKCCLRVNSIRIKWRWKQTFQTSLLNHSAVVFCFPLSTVCLACCGKGRSRGWSRGW